MREKIYFVQVEDATSGELEQIRNSLTGFLNSDNANAIVVPERVKPLDKDEARDYLEDMADALDMEVEEK